MIYDNYVSILVLYYLFMYYGIFGRYIKHSMLDLIKENMIFIYNKHPEKLPTNVLSFMATSNSSATTFYNEVIDNIQCQLLFKS